MSNIQNDLRDGKKRKPLEDVEAELVDQIPKTLIEKANKINLGMKAQQIWLSGNADRDRWLQKQRIFLKDWDEFLESSAEGPFEGSSSLHLPWTFIVTKTYHARLLQALVGDDFRFPAKARREDSSIREQMISDTLRYTLKEWSNHHTGVEEELDEWVWSWCSTGVGLLKWSWDAQYTRFVDVQTRLEIENRFTSDIEGNETVTPIPVTIEFEKATTKEVFNGPVLKNISAEDLLIIGGKGDPQKADVVIHRLWLSSSELWTLSDRKIFDKKAIEGVLAGGDNKMAGSSASDIKQDRAFTGGKSSLDSEDDLDRYEILETYWDVDIDNSGINSQVVTWTHVKSNSILRATYLHRVSPDGKKPFFKADFFKRKDQDYGIGLAEILHPLSKEIDAIHNMRIDFGILSTMPFGFVRAGSSIDPETIKLSPGALITVDDPSRDVVFPNMPTKTQFGTQEENALNTMVERLTGISDLSLGAISGAQGPTRTATGTRAVQAEVNSNLDVHLKRLARTWKKVLEYVFHLLQKRIPPGMSFRVTGDDGADYWQQVVNKNDLIGDFDFEIGTGSAASNPQVRQQVADEILQIASNPLAIQLGVVTPSGFYNAVKNVVQSREVKDFNKYFTRPPEFNVQLSPHEEFNRIINGIDVPVTANMDHEGFVKYFQFILSKPELLGTLSEEQTLKVANQAKKHAGMAQALQQMQAQAANAQQIKTNSALSTGAGPSGPQPAQGGGLAPANEA